MKVVFPRICAYGALALWMLAGAHGGALAQEPEAAAPAPRQVNPVVAEKLVKYAIIAIDQGNVTGNYSVLRELGTLNFQATTSSARLSDAFAPLRKMGLDMSALVMLKPVFSGPLTVEDGQLKMAGHFPTTPVQINFTMTYAQQNGQPRLAGVSITPVKAGEAAAAGKTNQQ